MHCKLTAIPLLLLASAAAGRTAGGKAPGTEAADTVIVVDKVQVTAIKQGLVLRSQPLRRRSSAAAPSNAGTSGR